MRDAGRFKSRTSARPHAVAIETDECDDVKEAEHTEARTSLLICPSPTAVWKASTHVVIFVVLTMMHAFALLVFKLNEIDGEYPFSAASILVVVEGLKLVLATLLHRGELIAIGAPAGPIGFVASFRRTSTCSLVIATVTISAMYTVNNLLSFFCVRKMDPGTLSYCQVARTVPHGSGTAILWPPCQPAEMGVHYPTVQWCGGNSIPRRQPITNTVLV